MKRFISTFTLYFMAQFVFAQFQYISPVPGTERHNPETNIILRNGDFIDAASVQDRHLLQIRGSLSGLHSWEARLSDDRKTVIIKPNTVFQSGEKVVVTVHDKLRTANGQTVKGTGFSFKIRDDLSPQIQQQMQDAVSEYYLQTFGYDPYKHSKPAGPVVHLVGPPPFTINVNVSPASGTNFYESHQQDAGNNYSYDTYLTRVDNNGNILWYSDVGDQQGNDFKVNENGYLTYFNQFGSWYIILDSNFNKIDSVQAGNGYGNKTDNHDCVMYPDGHTFLIVYDNEVMDLSQYGGQPHATVQVPVIQELDSSREVVFQWRSFDYFKITDANGYVNIKAGTVDPVHTNSIFRDNDGNIVISNRNMSEVTKIDHNTGNIIWRWGGKNNQFTFKNDPDTLHFDSQHHVERIANGDITMFNNANQYPVKQSSAKEYRLDEANKTATYVWSYIHPDINGVHLVSNALGSVQRLSNGNTLIDWGDITGKTDQTKIPNFTEVDSNNVIVWEFTYDSTDINTYRVQRLIWNPCSRVTSYTMNTSNIKNDQATLNWQDGAGAASYIIQYHEISDPIWSSVTAADTALTITGLMQNTEYEWRIETQCNIDSKSVYSGFTLPVNFTTTNDSIGTLATDLSAADKIVRIYPVPANDYINLHFSSSVTGTLEIYDAVGKLVFQDLVNVAEGQSKVINSKNWARGVYFVKIATSDENIMKKISVQ